MRQRRFRFTLRQWLEWIGVCAVFLAVLRTPAAPWVVGVSLVLPGFLIGRARGHAGIWGGAISAWIAFAGSGIAGYAYYYFFPEPNVVDYVGPVFTLGLLSVYGVIWGTLVGMALHFAITWVRSRLSRRPLSEASCGPILWRDLADPVERTAR
jgi:hypothetical protein